MRPSFFERGIEVLLLRARRSSFLYGEALIEPPPLPASLCIFQVELCGNVSFLTASLGGSLNRLFSSALYFIWELWFLSRSAAPLRLTAPYFTTPFPLLARQRLGLFCPESLSPWRAFFSRSDDFSSLYMPVGRRGFSSVIEHSPPILRLPFFFLRSR